MVKGRRRHTFRCSFFSTTKVQSALVLATRGSVLLYGRTQCMSMCMCMRMCMRMCTRACACTSCACTIHSLVHVCMLWWPVEQDRPASGQDEGRLLLRCREERAAKGMLLPTLHRPNLRLHAPISTRPYRAGHRRALRQPRLRHRSSLPKLYYICAPGLQCSSLSESWPCGPLARPQHTLRHRRLTRAAHTVVILKGCHRTRSLMFLHSC